MKYRLEDPNTPPTSNAAVLAPRDNDHSRIVRTQLLAERAIEPNTHAGITLRVHIHHTHCPECASQAFLAPDERQSSQLGACSCAETPPRAAHLNLCRMLANDPRVQHLRRRSARVSWAGWACSRVGKAKRPWHISPSSERR